MYFFSTHAENRPIAAPNTKAAITESLVESLDLFPTIAALAGLTAPVELQGKSLQSLLSDSSATIHDAVFTQVNRNNKTEGRSVRTLRWRFTQWTGGPLESNPAAELYDEQNDPEELTNLAGEPRHADTIAELKRRLAGGTSAR